MNENLFGEMELPSMDINKCVYCVCRQKLKKAETRVIIPSDYRRQHYKCIFYAWCINLLGTEPRIYLSRMNVTNGTRAYLQGA